MAAQREMLSASCLTGGRCNIKAIDCELWSIKCDLLANHASPIKEDEL